MKKLVLVLASAIVLTVFIAFNYLLWDRENKIKSFENINDSKNVSIDSLKKEVQEHEKENSDLKFRAETLGENIKSIQDDNYRLNAESENIKKKLYLSSSLINKLIESADTNAIQQVIKKWADSIDKQQYEAAYNLQYNHSASITLPTSIGEFKKGFQGIKSFKLKSIKPYTEKVLEDKEGCMVFKVVVDVKKEGSVPALFNNGINERCFAVSLNEKNEWVIADVFILP